MKVLIDNPFYLEDSRENLPESTFEKIRERDFLFSTKQFYLVTTGKMATGNVIAIAFNKRTAANECEDLKGNRIGYYSFIKNKLYAKNTNKSNPDKRTRKA